MISIVTGTLNRLNLLKLVIQNTVDSCDKLELILVDGGSTDGTIEYIKSLNHPQIKLIEIGGRSSYPHFMNMGIKESKYDYICQWNDDVLLVNNWDDVIKEIDNSDYFIFPWCRGELKLFLEQKYDDIYKLSKILFNHCMNFGIYHRIVFKKIGLYDMDFKYYCCDEDMTFRCMYFGLKSKILDKFRVFEIETINGLKLSKNAKEDNIDRKLLHSNIENFYKFKKIKNNIEFL
jgi:glycosyltransferase involved in cell wall biosynthesis